MDFWRNPRLYRGAQNLVEITFPKKILWGSYYQTLQLYKFGRLSLVVMIPVKTGHYEQDKS